MKIINIKKLLIKVLETTPVGKIDLYAGAITQSVSSNKITTNAPNGWLLCDGSVLLISDYPKLAAALGSKYGGNGTTTFGLPNFTGRVPVGANSSYPLGTPGGATQHRHTTGDFTLAQKHIPAHTHGKETLKSTLNTRYYAVTSVSGTGTTSTTIDWSGSHAMLNASTQTSGCKYDTTVIDHTHTHNSYGGDSNGNTVAHNHGNTDYQSNFQPYLGINYIIYTGVTR